MRFINVPLTKLCSFVLVEAKMRTKWDLTVLENIRKVQIGGCIVGWITAKNHEQVNLASVNVNDEIFYRFGLVNGISVDRIGVENRLANIAKLPVDGVDECMHVRGLVITSNNDAGITVSSQVDQQRVEESHSVRRSNGVHRLR